MTHSHLVVNHLLKWLESGNPLVSLQKACPDWLADLANQISELFSPLTDVARAGYQCQWIDDCWELTLFLGEMEVVGGPCDGEQHRVGFVFDVASALDFFSEVHQCQWGSFSSRDSMSGEATSVLIVQGMIAEEPLRLQIVSEAPAELGTAMRLHADGRCEVID